jgi:hypothetical protein
MQTQAHNNSTDVTSESIKWRDAADSWDAVEGQHQAAPGAAVGLDAARHTYTAHRAPSQCQRQTLNAAESETKDGPSAAVGPGCCMPPRRPSRPLKSTSYLSHPSLPAIDAYK